MMMVHSVVDIPAGAELTASYRSTADAHYTGHVLDDERLGLQVQMPPEFVDSSTALRTSEPPLANQLSYLFKIAIFSNAKLFVIYFKKKCSFREHVFAFRHGCHVEHAW